LSATSGSRFIGRGIGGLTAAVPLRRSGFEVDVYEQAPELNEVGGGINMVPNAVRNLHDRSLILGDCPAIREMARY
jgi:2-polyprenyl-6-methoxyphenol hydroxylase-like FAD-dependent oxidoreductase